MPLVGWRGWLGMVGAVGVFDGGGGPPGQVLGQREVSLGVAAWLVAGEGDGAKDPRPARQWHDHRRPQVEGGEQLQVAGVVRDAAKDVWSANLASSPASAGSAWATVWCRMVPSGWLRRS